MGSLVPAVPPSVPSSFLADAANPTGKGPVATGPGTPVSEAVNGTAPVDLPPAAIPWQDPELGTVPPDYIPLPPDPHAGPWPAVPQVWDGKEPAGTWPADQDPPPGYYRVPPAITGLAQTREVLPGHDAHSQLTDTAGWEQYTPSGRSAARQGWQQHYDGVEPFWWKTTPNLARARVAMGAGQSINGTVATYGGLANSGGNQAYEAPVPPAVTQQEPVSAYTATTVPRWGFS